MAWLPVQLIHRQNSDGFNFQECLIKSQQPPVYWDWMSPLWEQFNEVPQFQDLVLDITSLTTVINVLW